MKEQNKIRIRAVSRAIFLVIILFLLSYLPSVFSARLDFKTNESIAESFYNVKDETIEIINKGMSIKIAFNLLNRGEVSLKSGDYNKVKEITLSIDRINKEANNIFTAISKTRTKINELRKIGLNLSTEESVLNSAVKELEIGNFDGAEEQLKKITAKLDAVILNSTIQLEKNLEELDKIQIERGIESALIREIADEIKKARKKEDYSYIIQIANEFENINNSINTLLKIYDEIGKLQKKGRKTIRINDLRLEAINALSNRDYEIMSLINSEIEYLSEIINNTEEVISITKTKLGQLQYLEGIDDVNHTIYLAVQEFDNENYENAQDLIQESYGRLNRLEAQSLLFGTFSAERIRINLIRTIVNDPLLILIIISSGILLTLLYNRTARYTLIKLYTGKVNTLEKEKNVITSLIKKNQLEYFVKRVIDKETYRTALSKHQERLIKINENMSVLRNKMERIKKTTKKQKGNHKNPVQADF